MQVVGYFGSGTATSTTILDGGTETVNPFGTDDSAQISGGTQNVLGFAGGDTIFTGSQIIASGGMRQRHDR